MLIEAPVAPATVPGAIALTRGQALRMTGDMPAPQIPEDSPGYIAATLEAPEEAKHSHQAGPKSGTSKATLNVGGDLFPENLEQQCRIVLARLRQMRADLIPAQLRVSVDVAALPGVLRPVQRADRYIGQPVVLGAQRLPDKA